MRRTKRPAGCDQCDKEQDLSVQLKPGLRLRSTTCQTEIIVVSATDADVDLTCGGAAMAALGGDEVRHEPDPSRSSGSLLGKRYVDEGGTLELLCTRGGQGSLWVGDAILKVKEAKQLPASD